MMNTMMMTMMLAATTLTVVTGADGDIDQCQLAPYTDQCVPQCGGKPENVACPLSDLAHESWAKGLWNDWGLDNVDNYVSNVGSNVDNYVSNVESNVDNYVSNVVNHDWGGWHKGANNAWTYPTGMCDGPCSKCSVMCGGTAQNTGSCYSSCNGAPDWTAWAKSAGIEDYNGTSTGTWSDEDADVIVPAAAGGDTAVTAASAEESSSSMGAASSLALLVVATATIATTMMM